MVRFLIAAAGLAVLSFAARAATEALPEASAAAGHDHLGPIGMFLAADIVVKGVMVTLALASVVTWTIVLAKMVELAVGNRRAKRDLAILASAHSLRETRAGMGATRGPVAQFVTGALDEAGRSSGLPAEGIKERAAALLARVEARAGRSATRGTSIVATIGSSAPFVGLFGTVWGIMNSFIGIAKTNTTNLAVVAPGIAEALLATAIGLVAAIPAVILYNLMVRGITGYRALLGDAAGEVLRHLSRDLDRDEARGGSGRAASLHAAE